MNFNQRKPRPKTFVEACDQYLEVKRAALMASIKGTPQEAALMACAADKWLLPYEGAQDIPVFDLFGINPHFWWVKVKAELLTEPQAKRMIAEQVEREIGRWHNAAGEPQPPANQKR